MKGKTLRCPYCGSTAILKDSSYIYGSKARRGKVYVCSRYPMCDAHVGVKPGTALPNGTLANKSLRQKRIQAHQVFDQIWLSGILSRNQAYFWASDKLGVPMGEMHIGNFDVYRCDQLIREAKKVLENNHKPLHTAIGRRVESQMKKESVSTWQALVEKNLYLVTKVIRGLSISNSSIPEMNADELYQIGCLALCKAAIHFDEKRPFEPYAKTVIRNALLDQYRLAMRYHQRTCSIYDSTPDTDEIPMETLLRSRTGNPESEVLEAETAAYLRMLEGQATGIMSKGIATILLTAKGYNSTDIAQHFGVQPNHIRAWKSKAAAKLRSDKQIHALLS